MEPRLPRLVSRDVSIWEDAMTQNPRPVLGYATPEMERVKLKQIATGQRIVILCILANIILYIILMTVAKNVPALAIVILLAYIAGVITAAVFLFKLAINIYGVATGIILGIGTLIPLVGLIILLVVNGKATKILRGNGLKVGFLGANPSSIQ
jgi:hypothetical protein